MSKEEVDTMPPCSVDAVIVDSNGEPIAQRVRHLVDVKGKLDINGNISHEELTEAVRAHIENCACSTCSSGERGSLDHSGPAMANSRKFREGYEQINWGAVGAQRGKDYLN